MKRVLFVVLAAAVVAYGCTATPAKVEPTMAKATAPVKVEPAATTAPAPVTAKVEPAAATKVAPAKAEVAAAKTEVPAQAAPVATTIAAPAKAEPAAPPSAPAKPAEPAAPTSVEKPAVPNAAAPAPTVDSLMALMTQKVKDVKDLSADVQQTREDAKSGGGQIYSGTLKCLSPDFMRLELSATEKSADGEETWNSSTKQIRNANIYYQESSGRGVPGGGTVATKTDLVEWEKVVKEAAAQGQKLGSPATPDYINYLKWWKDSGAEIKLLKVAQDLATFEIWLKNPQGQPRHQEDVVVSTADGLLRSVTYYYRDAPYATRTLTNIKTNTGLKVGDFVYAPAAGTRVRDDVEATRNMLKAQHNMAKPAPAGGGK